MSTYAPLVPILISITPYIIIGILAGSTLAVTMKAISLIMKIRVMQERILVSQERTQETLRKLDIVLNAANGAPEQYYRRPSKPVTKFGGSNGY